MESSLNKDKVAGGDGIRPCECPQKADERPLDTLALKNQECVFSNVNGTTVNQGNCFVGESPLLNKGAIGASRLQLIKGSLYSIKHGGITLAHDDTFLRRIDDGATDRKLPGMLFIVIVGDRRVLVGCHHASICQQLYHSRLILQNGQVDRGLARLLTGVTGSLQIGLLHCPGLHAYRLAAQVRNAFDVLRIASLYQQRLPGIEVGDEVKFLLTVRVNCDCRNDDITALVAQIIEDRVKLRSNDIGFQAHALSNGRDEINIKAGSLIGCRVNILLRRIRCIASYGQGAGSNQVLGRSNGWSFGIRRRYCTGATIAPTSSEQDGQDKKNPHK